MLRFFAYLRRRQKLPSSGMAAMFVFACVHEIIIFGQDWWFSENLFRFLLRNDDVMSCSFNGLRLP